MSQDQLVQAHARLKSMKDNLPKTVELDNKYPKTRIQTTNPAHPRRK